MFGRRQANPVFHGFQSNYHNLKLDMTWLLRYF